MSDILQSLLGGVSTVGSYLDKGTGGRALRGLAAGRPRELASILPFSDTTGLTDPRDQASGRDVTDTWGLTKRGNNNFGSNALGFGADMLLNPLSLAGGVSAFRAAPTALKGFGAAAKSVTGLDALEHAGGGIRDLLMGEEGAAKIPHIPPNPIDVEKFDQTHLAANATRPRRYSTDPARQQFYANDRKSRFGSRFGSGQRPEYSHPPGDIGIIDRLKGFVSDEGGWMEVPGLGGNSAPYSPGVIAQTTGKTPSHLGFDEALNYYNSWVQGLKPKEREALKVYTGANQPKISHAYRGQSTTAGGHPYNPFEDFPGFPNSVNEVKTQVAPYLESSLSRGSTPRDIATYRLAGQLGSINPLNADQFIGKTVSDLSPLSTTINPWGNFYGGTTEPSQMLLDILMPKGSPGGYLGGLSSWQKEKELLLPPGLQMEVKHARQLPVKQFEDQWYRLDPAGKPIPQAGWHGSPLFTDNAEEIFQNQIVGQGKFGPDVVVPDELMAPNWRELLSGAPESQQANILLEVLAHPKKPMFKRLFR